MSVSLAARGVLGLAVLAAAYDIVSSDERFNRIPNRRLLFYLGLAGAGYAILLAAAALASFGGLGLSFPYPPWEFFPAAAAQPLLGAGAAVLLWRLGQWPAGDAKLFAVASFWLAVADPASPLLPWRLPLVFLMNVFIPAAVFVLVRTAVWVWRDKLRHLAGFWREMGFGRSPEYLREGTARLKASLKDSWARWRASTAADPTPAAVRAVDLLAMTAAGAAVTVWLGPRFGLRLPGPLLGIAACLGWDAVRRTAGSRASWVVCVLGLAAAGWGQPEGSWSALGHGWVQWLYLVLVMEAGMVVARFFLGVNERIVLLVWAVPMALALIGGPRALLGLLGAGEATFLRWAGLWLALGTLYALVSTFLEEDVDRLPLEKFHPWLVPAPPTVELLRSEPEFFEEHFSRIYPDGMTTAQTAALTDFCRRRGLTEAAFRRTTPFAKWIFFGGLLTYQLRGDVLNAFLAGRG